MQFTMLPFVAPQHSASPVVDAPVTGRAVGMNRFRHPPRPMRNPLRPAPAQPMGTLVIVDTAKWGPLLWRAVHTAAEVGGIDTATWQRIIHELQMALPCPDCMQHYRAWVLAHPFHPGDDAAQWWLDLHNAVNARLRGGRVAWTRESVTAAHGDRAAGAAAVTALAGMVGENALALLRAAYGL